ncbi:MAG: hypothetical protein ABSG95_07045 [Solirubrobacteraceae bacterium]|jgi:hypothetical protein
MATIIGTDPPGPRDAPVLPDTTVLCDTPGQGAVPLVSRPDLQLSHPNEPQVARIHVERVQSYLHVCG